MTLTLNSSCHLLNILQFTNLRTVLQLLPTRALQWLWRAERAGTRMPPGERSCTPGNTVAPGVWIQHRPSGCRFVPSHPHAITGKIPIPSSSPLFWVVNSVCFVLFFSNHQYTGYYKISEPESQRKHRIRPRNPQYNKHVRSRVTPVLWNFSSSRESATGHCRTMWMTKSSCITEFIEGENVK